MILNAIWNAMQVEAWVLINIAFSAIWSKSDEYPTLAQIQCWELDSQISKMENMKQNLSEHQATDTIGWDADDGDAKQQYQWRWWQCWH